MFVCRRQGLRSGVRGFERPFGVLQEPISSRSGFSKGCWEGSFDLGESQLLVGPLPVSLLPVPFLPSSYDEHGTPSSQQTVLNDNSYGIELIRFGGYTLCLTTTSYPS